MAGRHPKVPGQSACLIALREKGVRWITFMKERKLINFYCQLYARILGLQILSQLILTTTLQDWYYHHLHFTAEIMGLKIEGEPGLSGSKACAGSTHLGLRFGTDYR